MSNNEKENNAADSILLLDDTSATDTRLGLEKFANLEKFIEQSIDMGTSAIKINRIQNEALLRALEGLRNKMPEMNRINSGKAISSKE